MENSTQRANPKEAVRREPNPRIRKLALDITAILLLGLLVCLFFWRILTPDLADRGSFPPGDFAYQFWAFASLEARELAAGQIPLWNPYTYAGAPFWADIQSAVLYPFSLLTVLLTGPQGFSLFILELEAILHFWLAGIFTYMFGRRLFGHRGVALFAAIVFTFSGYLTGYPSQQLAVLETNIWLPLILFWVDRALVDRSGQQAQLRSQVKLIDILAAGFCWGLAILAGHPQSAMFVFYTLAAYTAFLALAYRNPNSKPSLLTILAHWLLIVGIGFGFSAVAWLPGLEYMQLSVRAAGFYDKMSGGFPLYDPIQMLLPGSVSHYSPLYIGIMPLLLAVWAALSLRRRMVYLWAGLAIVAFLLSFGGETFLYTPFYLVVPGFGIFRDQERAAFVFSLAMAMLAGYGFKAQFTGLLSGKPAPKSVLPRVCGWLLIGSLGLIILFFYGLNAVGWQDDSPFNVLLSRSVWLAILLGLSWALLHAASSSQAAVSKRRWLPVPVLLNTACLLLVTLDLFTANWETNVHPALPETQTAIPNAVQAIHDDAEAGDVFRVYNEYRVYENYGVPYQLEDTWGASPLRSERYDAMYGSLRMERVWELLNVQYVITWREELYAPSQIIYQEPTENDVTYVHRLDQTAPRAWLVYDLEEVEDAQALSRLDDFDFQPMQAALVPPGTSCNPGQPSNTAAGQVEISSRSNGSLSLQVSGAEDALLVISELYYPGWQATVDGNPAEIVRTNYTLRGIAVPAGSHQVQLVFRPTSFLLGSLISSATLLVIFIAGIWAWMRRPKESFHQRRRQ